MKKTIVFIASMFILSVVCKAQVSFTSRSFQDNTGTGPSTIVNTVITVSKESLKIGNTAISITPGKQVTSIPGLYMEEHQGQDSILILVHYTDTSKTIIRQVSITYPSGRGTVYHQ